MFKKSLPMTGFKPGSFVIGSDRAINCATAKHWNIVSLLGSGRGQVVVSVLAFPLTVSDMRVAGVPFSCFTYACRYLPSYRLIVMPNFFEPLSIRKDSEIIKRLVLIFPLLSLAWLNLLQLNWCRVCEKWIKTMATFRLFYDRLRVQIPQTIKYLDWELFLLSNHASQSSYN